MMAMRWQWMLMWVLLLDAVALYLFTTGFFLTRFEVTDVSQCHVLPSSTSTSHLRQHNDPAHGDDATIPGLGCWMPKRFDRVIFVVVDALRYDFAHFASSRTTDATAVGSFYLNHLPIFNQTIENNPHHSLLLKFVADPPTMTMQRLKGLTTGSLPTFLDIKDNMASSEIMEDNLIRQMHQQQRPIVFMGDDTWVALYAKYFTRAYAYDSFNVKDLDTVDNGVRRHLFPELQQQADWKLLIAHFLGVDHVGHTHGPSSPFMTKKLDEMNSVLTDLITTLPDDDTLLVVMGDHGMSEDGNHGGASDEETGAALFLYSKRPLVSDHDEQKWAKEVPQVDLVPTLALLSGLPIPFGNLGSVIPQLFFFPIAADTSSTNQKSSILASYEMLNQALELNLDQVRRYLFTYSSASKLPERAYDHLEKQFNTITRLKIQLEELQNTDGVTSEPYLIKIYEELIERRQEYLREALSLGRSIWTQFDYCCMTWGILLLIWSLLLVIISLVNPTCVFDHKSSFPLFASIIGFVVGMSVPSLPLLPSDSLARALGCAAVCGSIAVSQQLRVPHLRSIITKFPALVNVSTLVAFVVILLHALALLSNSYIVAEDRVLHFLSMSVGVFLLLQSHHCSARTNSSDSRRRWAIGGSLAFICATRVATAVDTPNIILSSTSITRTFAPLLMIILITGCCTYLLANNKTDLAVLSSFGRVMAATVIFSCISCGMYWTLTPIQLSFWSLWLPRFVYLVFLGSICFLLVRGWRSYPKSTSDSLLLLFQLLPAYTLVLGPTSPLSVLCLVVQLLSFAVVTCCCHWQQQPPTSWVLLWSVVVSQSFFFTGHQSTFTSLQNAAGFVGFDDFHFYFAGVLLALNTFGNYAIALLALPYMLLMMKTPVDHVRSWWRCAYTVVFYFLLNALVSTLFVTLQRRHLMVWAIFAPKFIFDAITLFVVTLVTVFVSFQVHNGVMPLKYNT